MKNPQHLLSAIHDCRLPIGCLLAGAILFSPMQAQSPSQLKTTTAHTPTVQGSPNRYEPDRFAGRAKKYYGLVWGVDSLSVKSVESGELVRFSYRVLDAHKAKALNDKKLDAFLIAPDAQIRLSVPSLENVGQLRQSGTAEAGKFYWMAFSNPGRRVRRGDRVDVVIGRFRAGGLIVD